MLHERLIDEVQKKTKNNLIVTLKQLKARQRFKRKNKIKQTETVLVLLYKIKRGLIK